MVFKKKSPLIRCTAHGSLGCLQCNSSCKRTHWLTKISRKAKITSKKQKVRKSGAFFKGGEDQLNVNGTAKNTLVLINVLNNTNLFLDYQPHKTQFTRENITLKTLVLRGEANTLSQCKSNCEKQAGSDKNWGVKLYSLMSCCFKRSL